MSTNKQSQSAARRRGELHHATGDRQVGQAIRARHQLIRRPLNALSFPRKAGHALS
jgi:hypothetical protein